MVEPCSRIASVMIRVLRVLNLGAGGLILTIFVALLIAPHWTAGALGMREPWPAFAGLRAIPALGLIGVALNHLVLGRLLAIVRTIRTGAPFLAANVSRLETIAWALLVGQALSLAIAGVARMLSTPQQPLQLGGGFSTSGLLLVLLIFLLARIFAQGAVMRDELDGTI